MAISWPGGTGEIHTRILEAMREVLFGEEEYPYLSKNASARLATARRTARASGMHRSMLVALGGGSYALFPWLGTRAFRTVRRALLHFAPQLGISEIRSEGCVYITFRREGGEGEDLLFALSSLLAASPDTPDFLVSEREAPALEKYDRLVPPSLLRAAFAKDRLCLDEVKTRLLECGKSL